MKEDSSRFFRARHKSKGSSQTISVFCEEAVERDRAAFCRLMGYLRENDQNHTVVMVQVENEIGFLGSERDYGLKAEERYCSHIPEDIAAWSGKKGSWKEAFGEDAPEYFMAYHYAKAIECIAGAGKKIYPLPMYVNAWISQHPVRPGAYPSGGPVAKLIPLWQKAAPSIDLCAPDIYLAEFAKVCEDYSASGNPLFIPEARRSPVVAANALYALGGMQAMGFSPFGVEALQKEEKEIPNIQQLMELNIDVENFTYGESAPYLAQTYHILQNLEEELNRRRGTDKMAAFIRRDPNDKGCIIAMDGYDIQLDYTGKGPGKPGSAGLILKEDGGFSLIGMNVRFRILPKKGSGANAGISRYEEGEFAQGIWKRGRILNGDEIYDTSLGDMPACRFVKVCVYE